MRSPRSLLGVFLIFILVFAAFFYRNETLSFLGLVRSLDYEKFEMLRLENLALKNELERLREKNQAASDFYLAAKIYSRYPFNDRRLITINLGENDGVRVGMPVAAKEGTLLGKIKQVFGRESVVETIFDPAWRSSATIGSGEVKALLEGGSKPMLTLISKESVVAEGEKVFNTSPEFPMGLLLGEAEGARPSTDDIWLTAGLNPLYDFDDLTEVLVITNFP